MSTTVWCCSRFLKPEKLKLPKTYEHYSMLAKVNLLRVVPNNSVYLALFYHTVLQSILKQVITVKRNNFWATSKQKLSCSHTCPNEKTLKKTQQKNLSYQSRLAVGPQSTHGSYEQVT